MSTTEEWWQPYVANCGREKPSILSRILAETFPVEPLPQKLLDIGCGTGIIGLYCLLEKKASSVTFIDVMQEWIDIARANVRHTIENGDVSPSQVDVMDPLPFDRISPELVVQHDMVVFNLPQFPESFVSQSDLSEIEADALRARYRLAGPDGLKLARDFCRWYGDLKRPRPDAVCVLWSILGKRQIIEVLKSNSLQWTIVQETMIALKPEFSPIAAHFFENAEERDNRMLGRDGDGWTQHVLTIRLTGI